MKLIMALTGLKSSEKSFTNLKSGVGYLIYSRNLDRDGDDDPDYKRLVLFHLHHGETDIRYVDDNNSKCNAECVWDIMTSDEWRIDGTRCLDDYVTGISGDTYLFEMADDEFASHVIAESI